MPYYRILNGQNEESNLLQELDCSVSPNINSVYQMLYSKTHTTYRQDFIDVEVQMLSKLCKAVQDFEKKDVKTIF